MASGIAVAALALPTLHDEEEQLNTTMSYIFRTLRGNSAVLYVKQDISYENFLRAVLEKSASTDYDAEKLQSHSNIVGERTSRGGVENSEMKKKRRVVNDVDDDSQFLVDLESKDEEYKIVDIEKESPSRIVYIIHNGKILDEEAYYQFVQSHSTSQHNDISLPHHISLHLRLRGGIDRQNRVGSKFGGGGVSSAQQAERERKERLTELAMENVDLANDPYLMKNHLGYYECKLCLTLHKTLGDYLAHTQGKKHTTNLAKRAYMEKKMLAKQKTDVGPVLPLQSSTAKSSVTRVKIGRPGYEISKSRHHETNQRCLSFNLHFPEIDSNLQPRHRFMSAYEQRVESPPDRRYQYLIIAAEPYETVSFKIPNEEIDRNEGMFVTNWDADEKRFTLTLYFVDTVEGQTN